MKYKYLVGLLVCLYSPFSISSDFGLLLDVGFTSGGDQVARNYAAYKLVSNNGVTIINSDGERISAGGGFSPTIGLFYTIDEDNIRIEVKRSKVSDSVDLGGRSASTSVSRDQLLILKNVYKGHYLGLGISKYFSASIKTCGRYSADCLDPSNIKAQTGTAIHYMRQYNSFRFGISYFPVTYETDVGDIDASGLDFYLGWSI